MLLQAGLPGHGFDKVMGEWGFRAIYRHRAHLSSRNHLVMLMRSDLACWAESKHFQKLLNCAAVKLGLATYSAESRVIMKSI